MKKLHIIRHVGLWLLLLTACNTAHQTSSLCYKERTYPAAVSLDARDSLIIPQPFDLLTWSIHQHTVFFVTAGVEENFLAAYRYPEGEKRFEYGRIGQGPDEFLTLNVGKGQADCLLLYDIMGRKACLFDTAHDTICRHEPLSLYNDSEGYCKPFTDILQISSDCYLMKIDSWDSSEWEIANLKDGKATGSFKNPCRRQDTSYTPFDFVQDAIDTTLLVAYKYMDRVECYSIAGGKIQPLFFMGSSSDQADIKDYDLLESYYLDITTHDGCFYLLKSNEGKEQGRRIEVYDDEGTCRSIFNLDRELTSIRFDGEGRLVGYVADINQTILYRWYNVPQN